jgi:hypothetical protein
VSTTRGRIGCEVTYTTRDRGARSRLSTMHRKRSSYAGNTGNRWLGRSRLSEWTTTNVRGTSPTDRSENFGHHARRLS